MTKVTKIGILIAIILALVGIGLIFPSFFPLARERAKSNLERDKANPKPAIEASS